MKTLEVYAHGRLQRRYMGISQDRLDDLLDEWESVGAELDCDTDEIEWTAVL